MRLSLLGIDKKESAFCYPVELAHGFFQDLIDKKPDYIFLPHISEIDNKDPNIQKKTCVLLQSENYYLKSTFKNELKNIKVLSPVYNFSGGYENEKNNFIELAKKLGKDKSTASNAFNLAITQ